MEKKKGMESTIPKVGRKKTQKSSYLSQLLYSELEMGIIELFHQAKGTVM